MNTVLTQYANLLQKIYWYAYVQILWILFTLAGLVIFGLFPATYALLKVTKQQTDTSATAIFHVFRQAYRNAFFPINKASIIWITMLILMSSNLLILPGAQPILKLVVISTICFLLLCIVHFFHFFQTDKSTMAQIKRSFAHACLHPKQNVGYACIFLLLGAALWFIPGITCFFGVSITAKAITYIAQ
ncbi:YesL family protein [Pseudalkalibacillus sp. A8]|uniref:YesL family protein n=1 Tax=Pseudalkalibacillus sp. A8 TaxID=3382641 RepID=UPI0038B621EC